MSLFNELKRRNVIRVAIAYIVMAWLVMQFADVILNNIEAPGWVFQTILLLLGIGFLVAMFFSWAFEMTPEGLKREHEVDRSQSITPQTGKKLNTAILVLMALAITYLLFDKFSGTRPAAVSTPAVEVAGDSTGPAATAAPDTEPTVSRQSIAVLPFDNRSPDANDAYFAEGIHDDLLTNLARISSLKVISRTSVTQYKGTTKTIPQIAAELGVAHIMEGAVQRAGDSVRINVQLIDAQTDEHLWAEIFDRDLSAQNLFAIQSEISQAIADALKTTLTSEEQQRINIVPTQNLAAYEAYLRGRQLMATRESKKLEQSIESFREATTLDPEFALAWVGLADSHALLAVYGTLGRIKAIAAIRTATEKALSLDPELGEAHTSLGYLQDLTNEWKKAEVSFRKAIELSPNYAQAYHWYSANLKSFPLRVDEAIALSQKARELDPNSSIISLNLADSYETKGLYSMAEQQYRKSIELDPGFVGGYSALAETLTYNISRYPEALRNQRKAIELDPGNISHYGTLVDIYSDIGDFNHAQAVIERMSEVDSKHEANGYADVTFNGFSGNNAGVREAVNWTLPKLEGNPNGQQSLAFWSLAAGDTSRAKGIYLSATPGWTDPAQWDDLVARYSFHACNVAWILLHDGDEQAGAGLLDRAIRYLEDELPAVNEHADTFWPQVCQLTRGDTGAALETIERLAAHDHLFGWKVMDRLPMMEPIRNEPRYIAAMQERDRKIALQRAEIEAMQEQGAL